MYCRNSVHRDNLVQPTHILELESKSKWGINEIKQNEQSQPHTNSHI